MRTKVLICTAALAASLASSLADGNVYSLNVVGYVNITIPHGKAAAIANPLDSTMGGSLGGMNDITNLFTIATGNPQSGDLIETFNPAINNYNAGIKYSAISKAWGTGKGGQLVMNPGLGVIYINNSKTVDVVYTFVGQVQQGTAIPVGTIGAHAAAFLGSPVPIGGDMTNSIIGIAPASGDIVELFNPDINNYDAGSKYSIISKTWGLVGGKRLQIAPAQAFVYINNGGTPNVWTANFTVQ